MHNQTDEQTCGSNKAWESPGVTHPTGYLLPPPAGSSESLEDSDEIKKTSAGVPRRDNSAFYQHADASNPHVARLENKGWYVVCGTRWKAC